MLNKENRLFGGEYRMYKSIFEKNLIFLNCLHSSAIKYKRIPYLLLATTTYLMIFCQKVSGNYMFQYKNNVLFILSFYKIQSKDENTNCNYDISLHYKIHSLIDMAFYLGNIRLFLLWLALRY
jgi:hypothetical protein